MISKYRSLPVLYSAIENPDVTGYAFKKGYLEKGGHIGIRPHIEIKGAEAAILRGEGHFDTEIVYDLIFSHKDTRDQILLKNVKQETFNKITAFYQKIIDEQWIFCYR